MLFVLNSAGVPSVATFVRVSASGGPNQPPMGVIDSPASNLTVTAGSAVSFSGSGTDPDGSVGAYAWTFPGGSPASASVPAPGNVIYSAAGTYVASLVVTDNAGVQSEPATRTIAVTDFSLSATPTSQSVLPGGSGSYSLTTSPQNGFSGTIAFALTGLPSGATASVSPPSVSAGASATLTVATSTSTIPGSYPLTVVASSGSLSHSLNLTLVVTGDFSIAVTPSSRTIAKGGSGSYTVTITAGQGFSGTVNFSVSGLPKFATAKFSPASVVRAGSSVMSVSTNKNVSAGTSSLTVTGTSGGRARSSTVTLLIQ